MAYRPERVIAEHFVQALEVGVGRVHLRAHPAPQVVVDLVELFLCVVVGLVPNSQIFLRNLRKFPETWHQCVLKLRIFALFKCYITPCFSTISILARLSY